MNATDLPARVEVTVRCLCDCACHGGGYCLDTIAVDEGKRDCDHDCRGTESSIVCDPFIERTE